MSKTLESRDALFCLCCCTAFDGGNRPGARREARLLRREEAISHGYEQRAADSKHDFVILCAKCCNSRSSKAASSKMTESTAYWLALPGAGTSL